MEWIECARLSRFPWLLHAFSTRRGRASRPSLHGLNLGSQAAGRPVTVDLNWRWFLKVLGAEQLQIAALRQVHSSRLVQVLREDSGKVEYRPAGFPAPRAARFRSPSADALLSNQAGLLLSVQTADCMPILIVDPRRRAVAAVHAGWRGVLRRIVENAVGEMVRLFASRPADLVVAIGPSIRGCCYQVGREVVESFCGQFVEGERFFLEPGGTKRARAKPPQSVPPFPSVHPAGRPGPDVTGSRLDLVRAACAQLRAARVPRVNIDVANFCTACRTDLFFSFRKEGNLTGRMMSVVGIRARN